jgi:hypothetical protein
MKPSLRHQCNTNLYLDTYSSLDRAGIRLVMTDDIYIYMYHDMYVRIYNITYIYIRRMIYSITICICVSLCVYVCVCVYMTVTDCENCEILVGRAQSEREVEQ